MSQKFGMTININEIGSFTHLRHPEDGGNVFLHLLQSKAIALTDQVLDAVKAALMKDPALLTQENNVGICPLSFVMLSSNYALFDVYMECARAAGIDINAVPKLKAPESKKGWTILHIACSNEDSRPALKLLDSFPSINVNATATDGLTPLVLALRRASSPDVHVALVRRGASLDLGMPTAQKWLDDHKAALDKEIAEYTATGQLDKVQRRKDHLLNPHSLERLLKSCLAPSASGSSNTVSPTGLMSVIGTRQAAAATREQSCTVA